MLCQAGFFALRARRLMRFLAAPSVLAIASIAGAPPALAQVAVLDTGVVSELAAMQKFLELQLIPTAVTAATPAAYAAVGTTPIIAPPCPKLANAIAMAYVVAACDTLTKDVAAFNIALGAFTKQMEKISLQIAAISAAGVGTTVNVLSASMQLQALQAHQANLVGQHMANVEWIKLRFNNAETAIAQSRAMVKYGW